MNDAYFRRIFSRKISKSNTLTMKERTSVKKMNILHCTLNLDLDKSFTTARKSILKLIKPQRLAAKFWWLRFFLNFEGYWEEYF